MAAQIALGDVPYRLSEEFVSAWLDVDRGLVGPFADVTDDHAWIHVDVPRATELRGTIAHGLLVLALLPGMATGTRIWVKMRFIELTPRGAVR
jgi:acyl dehydratase